MIKNILLNGYFELKYRSKLISTYVYFVLFFSIALLMALAAGGAFQGVVVSFGGGSRVFVNAPMSVSSYLLFLSGFGLFIIAPSFGNSICRDFQSGMDQLIYSSPIKLKEFLIGRFVGAFAFCLFVFSSIPLGVYIASLLPFILPSMLGPNSFAGYLNAMLVIAIPQILIFGGLFFSLAAKTKKMTGIYVLTTLVFLLWSASGTLLRDLDNKMLASLLDPLGLQAFSQSIRYWTVFQKNHQIFGFESYFLWNRLLWGGLSFVSVVWALFSFSWLSKGFKKSQEAKETNGEREVHSAIPVLASRSFSALGMFTKQTFFEMGRVVKSIYFLVILLAGFGYMLVVGTQVGKMFGTNTYPVTYNILDFVGGTFSLFILIIITIYTGEAVWRDREVKMDQIIDSLPVKTPVLFLAKFTSLIGITVILLLAIMLAGFLIQLSHGYTNFEISQYLVNLFLLRLPGTLNLIVLTLFIHTLFNNKYIAHGAVVLFYLFDAFSSQMGLEHFLYRFSAKPDVMYSDMNGFGHVFRIYHLYNTYWLMLSGVLLTISYLLWQRGSERSSLFKSQLHKKISRPLLVLNSFFIVGFVSLGAYLFYQTNVRHEYVSSRESERRNVEYEQKYKSYEHLPHPTLESVVAHVDIFPESLKVLMKADMSFRNQTSEPIHKFIVMVYDFDWNLDWSVDVDADYDKKLDVVVYSLKKPLLPNQIISAKYSATMDHSGVRHGNNLNGIYDNGTFLNNAQTFPLMGYVRRNEITQNKTREKYGLESRKRMPDIHDEKYYHSNYIGSAASWIDFEATVSTSVDQIAIAPGYLQKEWVENNRRYFHYKMDQKMLNFYAFMSGRYEVKRDKWKDVNIEIYYHKGHEYNLDRMIKATHRSLDYFTTHFGPYQHRQYRVIEFPRYQAFAQAFPNTIPFSEGVGFIAKVDDKNPEDIDYPFYVNSHELAHQWWAHQLIGAEVQGSEMLSESFAQYSALMVMEKEYGRGRMQKFLKYELDRYLFGRGQEPEYENPLYLTEGQAYIHYHKGSLSLYALKDYLGEDVLNAAIRETLEQNRGRFTKYPTSLSFVQNLKKRVRSEQIPLVEDMLEKIVIFENRPLSAQAKKIKDDSYEVTLKVSSKKMYSTPEGKEEEVDFKQAMDIGVQDKDGQYIYLQKHQIQSGEQEIKIKTNGFPVKAGLDPLNILVDRNPSDNLMSVQVE